MANPVPSMNAMVDSITDAVESALHRGQTAGGLRRHMLQSAIRRVLRDIHAQRIPPRHFNGIHTKGSGGRRPSTPQLPPRWTPRPSSTLPPHMAPALLLLPPPPPLSSPVLACPRNGGGGPLASSHGAPLHSQHRGRCVAARLRLRLQRRSSSSSPTVGTPFLRRRGGQSPAQGRPPSGAGSWRRIRLSLDSGGGGSAPLSTVGMAGGGGSAVPRLAATVLGTGARRGRADLLCRSASMAGL